MQAPTSSSQRWCPPVSFPDGFDPAVVAPELKKEGSEWVAVFSTHAAQRELDIDFKHTFKHDSVVCSVRFSPDGKYLATGCHRSAQIYDTESGAKVFHVLIDGVTEEYEELYVRCLCFSPNGKLLATAGDDMKIRIWDIAEKCLQYVFEGHQEAVYSLEFSRDGRMIVSGSGDTTTRIWDMETGLHNVLSIPQPTETDARVTSVAISPDSRLVVTGSLDTLVRLWDVQTGQLIEQLVGHADSVYSVTFTPDGKGLVSGSLDKTMKYWDLAESDGSQSRTGRVCTADFMGHKDYVLQASVSHDSQWVVSGSRDRCVLFWDLHTAQVQLMLQGHKNSVISVDLSPTGGMLATGSGDWSASLWNYTTLQ